MITLPPWSYTQLDTFNNCPRQYFHRYILKEKEPETVQMRHGTEVHKALENRIRDGAPLPVDYAQWEPLAGAVAKRKDTHFIHCELDLALTKQLTPTGFFAPDVWGRGKADLVVLENNAAWIGDWKTGKVREKAFQVGIFAAFLFRMFPQLQKITANNIWLQVKKPGQTYQFLRAQEKQLWTGILQRIGQMEYAASKELFQERPSGLCGWCSVTVCKHNPKGDGK